MKTAEYNKLTEEQKYEYMHKQMKEILRICDNVGCKLSFVNKNDEKAVEKAFKGICEDITEKESK